VERASEAYLRSGEFRVADMISFLSTKVDTAIEEDFDLVRAAGEMSWVLLGPPGREDLFRYESALNAVVEHMPAILMCLYDLRKFGADMLIEVLRTHPTVLLDHTVIDNPLYVPPMEYSADAGLIAATRYPMVKVAADGDGGTDHGWASLTRAELRIISRAVRGMTNRGIAEELYLSRHTVDAHLKHIYLKLDIHSRVELTALALQRRFPTDQR
jgi:DNA-binding CsgD family transcriptional regulator